METLRVCFVGQGSAYLASHRMRVTKPAELLNVGVENVEVRVSPKADPSADINIFNKHFDQKGNFVSLCAGPSKGFYSVFDVCDDHFDRKHSVYYTKMCEKADHITCNSANMQERIYEVTGKLARIIPDPVTFLPGEPPTPEQLKEFTSKGGTPRLLWYGHGSNLKALKDWIDQLTGRKLTVISDVPLYHPNVDFVQWQPMIAEKRIMENDIVLIPTSNDPWVKYKSPNRAVDALHAGRFVITDNRDIYGHLEDYLYIIDSPDELPKAIEFWIKNPDKVSEMITKGQEWIQENNTDDVILDGWLNAFQDLKLIKEHKRYA